jgi:hypothetical protein
MLKKDDRDQQMVYYQVWLTPHLALSLIIDHS